MAFSIHNRSLAARDAGGRGGWDRMAGAFKLAVRTYRSRQTLPELPNHLLADIGIDRATALAEAARLPWDMRPARRTAEAHGVWPAIGRRIEAFRVRELLIGAAPNQVSWNG
jgi:uncharacterized protein YjiS (DUF1127 family)